MEATLILIVNCAPGVCLGGGYQLGKAHANGQVLA
jgi:hypothetical protein